MLKKTTYEQWTSIFTPTSSYEGSWAVASKMYFTAISDDGKKQGLIAEIIQKIENTFVSICHKGILDGDIEIYEGPKIEKWANALENYTFEHDGMGTQLTVHCDTDESCQNYFDENYPLALAKLKSICEL